MAETLRPGDTFLIDPEAVLDYAVDWTDWLGAGEGIASTTWTATGLTVGTGAYVPTESGGVTTVWLSGGTAGTTYTVECKITTDNVPARTDERLFYLACEER